MLYAPSHCSVRADTWFVSPLHLRNFNPEIPPSAPPSEDIKENWETHQSLRTVNLGVKQETCSMQGCGAGSRLRYRLTLVTGMLECLCFAGLVFGFASLVFVLKADGYFSDLCVSSPGSNSTGKSMEPGSRCDQKPSPKVSVVWAPAEEFVFRTLWGGGNYSHSPDCDEEVVIGLVAPLNEQTVASSCPTCFSFKDSRNFFFMPAHICILVVQN